MEHFCKAIISASILLMAGMAGVGVSVKYSVFGYLIFLLGSDTGSAPSQARLRHGPRTKVASPGD